MSKKWTVCVLLLNAVALLLLTIALATESWITATVHGQRDSNGTLTDIGTVKSGLFTGTYKITFTSYGPLRIQKFTVQNFYSGQVNMGMLLATIVFVILVELETAAAMIAAGWHLMSPSRTTTTKTKSKVKVKWIVVILTLAGLLCSCISFGIFMALTYDHVRILVSEELLDLFFYLNMQTSSQLGYGVWLVIAATFLLLVAFVVGIYDNCHGRFRQRRIRHRNSLVARQRNSLVARPDESAVGTLHVSELY
eukprot:m.309579 g.309579  ORF g.309579 m.309579 type:complete len:252 (+) comp46987_c0_seq1:47-802(+)